MGENDFVICADEKSQLQILRREFATLPANSNRPIRFENDYKREGTVAYLSALDVFQVVSLVAWMRKPGSCLSKSWWI